MRKAAVVAIAAISCSKLPATLTTAAALATVALASTVALAAAILWAVSGPVAKLAASEASSASTTASTLASTLALTTATEALATTALTRTTSASSHVRCIGFAFHVVPSLIVAHGISFDQILAVSKLVPVCEEILAAVVLDDESEALVIVEELDDPSLGHGLKFSSCELSDQTDSWKQDAIKPKWLDGNESSLSTTMFRPALNV